MSQTTSAAPPSFSQPDLKLYVRLAWRWAWLVILCALIGAAAAFMVSLNTTPVYQAASKIIINEARNPTASATDITASERAARTYAALMQRISVMNKVFEGLGVDPSLAGSQILGVTVNPVRDTQLVELTVTGPNPQLIAAVANTLPNVFVDELHQIQVSRYAESKASLAQQLEEMKRQVELTKLQLAELEVRRTAQDEMEYTRLSGSLAQYQTSYANLLQSYETLRLAEAQSTDTIVLIEPAVAPTVPMQPRMLNTIVMWAALGAMAAVGFVFLLEYLDDRVQTPEDLHRITNLPVLGAIGLTPGTNARAQGGKGGNKHRRGTSSDEEWAGETANLISITDPRHPIVEAFRRLRTNLQYYNLDSGLKSLLLSSAEAGEGKSTTAANLAVVMAQAGMRVVLVDADLRKPRLHRIFGAPRQPGLAEAMREGVFSPDLLRPVAGVANLRILTAGESVPNPAEVLGSQRMRDLVKQLQAETDILIFDTPPLLAVTDAQVVGHLVDGALMVINSQKTGAGAVHRALQSLAQVNVPVMGAILNRLSGSGRSYYYYYQYYSHDYYHDDTPSGKSGGKSGGKRVSQPQPAKTQPAGTGDD